MMVVVCSLKGSPGATTLAVALGTHWPAPQRPILVEADPAGGDVAARFRLPCSPGLASLAAAARGSADANLLVQHAHVLASGLRVVPAPADPVQTRAALTALSPLALHSAREPIVLDVGRADPDPAMLRLLRAADSLVVVTRPLDDALAHVAARRDQLRTWSQRPGLVLMGKGYPATQISDAIGVPVFANIPDGRPERHIEALAEQLLPVRSGSVR